MNVGPNPSSQLPLLAGEKSSSCVQSPKLVVRASAPVEVWYGALL